MKALLAILILALAMLIAGCSGQTQIVTKTQTVVIAPPQNLFICPQMQPSDYPTGQFSQGDAAQLIIKLENRGDICANSLAAIRDYINKAQAAGKSASLPKPSWR